MKKTLLFYILLRHAHSKKKKKQNINKFPPWVVGNLFLLLQSSQEPLAVWSNGEMNVIFTGLEPQYHQPKPLSIPQKSQVSKANDSKLKTKATTTTPNHMDGLPEKGNIGLINNVKVCSGIRATSHTNLRRLKVSKSQVSKTEINTSERRILQ